MNPAWAKGHDVDHLKAITALFKAHDAGMVHGPFGRYSEVDAVADLDRGWLQYDLDAGWAVVRRVLDRRLPVRDFTGGIALRLGPGTHLVSRMAWRDDIGKAVIGAFTTRGVVWAWQEHAGERALVEGGECRAVKISAASEMRGLYDAVVAPGLFISPYPPHQTVGLGRLPIDLPPIAPIVAQLPDTEFANHYSGYNKGGWSALSLRGFYDDPTRIEKPTEMNKRWRTENPQDLDRVPRDTPLRAQMQAADAVLSAIPHQRLERVRLMALAPGGGELTRHADITDHDAGADPGKVVRIHIPLLTNPDAVFTSWDLDGRRHSMHMAPGHAYYLDTRKPHTAVNNGATPRIHLVADVVASAQTTSALAAI